MPIVLNGSGPITGVTSLNTTVSDTEIGYLDGVTSAIQTQFNSVGDWTTYTPSWTNLTVGNGTNEGRYTQIGDSVLFVVRFQLGSTSSVGTAPVFTLPVSADTTSMNSGESAYGFCVMRDVGTATFHGNVSYSSASSATIFVYGVSGTRIINQDVTATVPMTWTTNDRIHIQGMYEAA